MNLESLTALWSDAVALWKAALSMAMGLLGVLIALKTFKKIGLENEKLEAEKRERESRIQKPTTEKILRYGAQERDLASRRRRATALLIVFSVLIATGAIAAVWQVTRRLAPRPSTPTVTAPPPSSTAASATDSSPEPTTPAPRAATVEARAQAPVTLPRPDHIVIVIEENKGFSDIVNSPNAPYLNSLVTQGASLTSFHALHHPSQPNYMELFSGNTQGVFNDTCLSGEFAVPSLGWNLVQKGLSFSGYAEDLPDDLTVCTEGRTYARKHCPWIAFADVPAESSVNFTNFPKDAAGFAHLPVVSLVVPNLVSDMHSTKADALDSVPEEVASGDVWLRVHLDAYAQWAKTHNSLLIVTWDEDSSSYTYPLIRSQAINTQPPENHIATILVGEMVTPGATGKHKYTHHDLLRTIEDMYGLPLIGGSQSARDIVGIWK